MSSDIDNVTAILQERFSLQTEFLGENKDINRIVPLVSVTVATYQHVHYIKECLDGILMQQTTFPYEIILGEDGSTDGTEIICKEYAEKYPNKIRLFIRDRSLSQYVDQNGKTIRFNGLWNRMAARGKYIAFCEGDDYWIDPFKLQKQVNFLEQNSDCIMCFHDAKTINQQTGIEINKFSIPIKNKISTKDVILKNWFVPSASMVFRSFIADELITYKKWHNIFPAGDLSLILIATKYGYIYPIREKMSVYRFLTPGSDTYNVKTHTKARKNLYNYGKFLSAINRIEFDGKYSIAVFLRRIRILLSIIKTYL